MSAIKESFSYKTSWLLRKYADDAAFAAEQPYEETEIPGNILLNAGITALLNLLIGAGGTAFNNANARIGVGDSSAAEAAGQTDLQAATNKTYVAMAATYPQVSAQTVTFRAVFGSAAANYAWAEFVVDNGTTKINRKVSSQGTKASGQTWTLDVSITLS